MQLFFHSTSGSHPFIAHGSLWCPMARCGPLLCLNSRIIIYSQYFTEIYKDYFIIFLKQHTLSTILQKADVTKIFVPTHTPLRMELIRNSCPFYIRCMNICYRNPFSWSPLTSAVAPSKKAMALIEKHCTRQQLLFNECVSGQFPNITFL